MKIFSSAKEMFEWDRNCLRCKKLNIEDNPITSSCDIWNALNDAFNKRGDGEISEKIAERMGFDEGGWSKKCKEIEVDDTRD